jgi:hypothetical protein
MSDNGRLGNLSPFPQEYRASGVLLHVTSLPSPYGISDMGRLPWLGWINSSIQVKAGGRRCRWARLVTATRLINRFRLSPVMDL